VEDFAKPALQFMLRSKSLGPMGITSQAGAVGAPYFETDGDKIASK
jgi:hypothetical protein